MQRWKKNRGREQAAQRRDSQSGGKDPFESTARHGWLFGMLAGFLFLGIGAVQGQFAVIFRKAVMICLECIGIG